MSQPEASRHRAVRVCLERSGSAYLVAIPQSVASHRPAVRVCSARSGSAYLVAKSLSAALRHPASSASQAEKGLVFLAEECLQEYRARRAKSGSAAFEGGKMGVVSSPVEKQNRLSGFAYPTNNRHWYKACASHRYPLTQRERLTIEVHACSCSKCRRFDCPAQRRVDNCQHWYWTARLCDCHQQMSPKTVGVHHHRIALHGRLAAVLIALKLPQYNSQFLKMGF